MSDEAKKALEAAVNKVAIDIGKIIGVVRRHPDLTEMQITTAYGYLGSVLSNVLRQALVAHQTAGSFSFDKAQSVSSAEMAAAITAAVAKEPTTSRTHPNVREGARRRAEGRMVGTKETVFTEEPKEKSFLEIEPAQKPDETGGIREAGFIED